MSLFVRTGWFIDWGGGDFVKHFLRLLCYGVRRFLMVWMCMFVRTERVRGGIGVGV